VVCRSKGTARQLPGHSGIELLFASSLPTAFPLDTISRQNKFPSRYPDNHHDMCQTERQVLYRIQILVLVRIDGVLPTPPFSNCVQHILLEPFQLRMPFNDMLPAFIGQRNPIAPTIRDLFQWLFSKVCLEITRNHLITLPALASRFGGIAYRFWILRHRSGQVLRFSILRLRSVQVLDCTIIGLLCRL